MPRTLAEQSTSSKERLPWGRPFTIAREDKRFKGPSPTSTPPSHASCYLPPDAALTGMLRHHHWHVLRSESALSSDVSCGIEVRCHERFSSEKGGMPHRRSRSSRITAVLA